MLSTTEDDLLVRGKLESREGSLVRERVATSSRPGQRRTFSMLLARRAHGDLGRSCPKMGSGNSIRRSTEKHPRPGCASAARDVRLP